MRHRPLGVVNPGPFGITIDPVPTCLTGYERLEIEQRCPTAVAPPPQAPPGPSSCPPGYTRDRAGNCAILAGLGAATGPLSGRLAGFDACALKALNLPSCADPQCIDEVTAGFIAACSVGAAMPPDVKAWCDSGAALAYVNLPYCARPGWMTPPPPCLTTDQKAQVDYCNTYGSQGPDPNRNVFCWAAMKDQMWWAEMSLRNACRSEEQPPTPLPPPLPLPPPDTTGDGRPRRDQSFAAMGVVGILLFVAAAGGGYYAYTRRKRR